MMQVALVPLLAWGLALLCWGVSLWLGPRPLLRPFVIDRALRYIFIFPLGVIGLWAFLGHVIFPIHAANEIGWQPSPFQFELGYANLGIGLAALYAAFTTFYARVAVAIATSCFFVGAGIGHVGEMVAYGNLTAGNAGPILVAYFLTPMAVLILLLMSARKPKQTLRSPDSLELEIEFAAARRAMRSYREALDKFVNG